MATPNGISRKKKKKISCGYLARLHIDTTKGYCSSYVEVKRFEKNAADCVTSESVVPESIDILKSTLSFAADNVARIQC